MTPRGFDTLADLVLSGETNWKQYGNVNCVEQDGLLLFNYGSIFNNSWNWFECVSRGLIIDKSTGKIVARPFDKFFNWGERTSEKELVEITEKIDGSLIIVYYWNGRWNCATRGSFKSSQAIWAQEQLSRYDLSLVPKIYTLLFEAVYPENRVVINYGDTRELYLIGMRNRTNDDDKFYPWIKKYADDIGCPTLNTVSLQDIPNLIEAAKGLSAHEEGWVLRFADGERLKIKGEQYKHLHSLISGLSIKKVAWAMANNCLNDTFCKIMDDHPEISQWQQEIQTTLDIEQERITKIFAQAPDGNKKTFALWATSEHKDDSSYLFALYSGKDIVPMLYKNLYGAYII